MNTKKLLTIAAALVVIAFVASCAGTHTRRSAGTYVDDKWISTKVDSKLAADPVTKMTEIDVTTFNGVVQLSGFVSTNDAVRRAEEIARRTEGVRSVQNNLVLRSSVMEPEGPHK